MKRSLLLILFIAICIADLQAQMTGGGSGDNVQKQPVSSKANDNRFWVLTFGLSGPMGKFGKNDPSIVFEEAVGANSGFFIGYEGAKFYPGMVAGPVQIGISTTANVAVNQVSWNNWGYGEGAFTPFVFSDFKLGAIGTYEPVPGLKVDGFLRLGVNLGVGAGGYWASSSFDESSTVSLYSYEPAVGFGANFGFNARYDRLLLTLQFNPGKLKFNYELNSYGYDSSDNYYDDLYEEEYKLPVSTVKLGVGVVFGKSR